MSETINRESVKLRKTAIFPKADREKTTAPIWLIRRMEASLKMPPPTLKEVRTQFKSSARIRKKFIDNQSV